jgi:hypothetical protein
MEKVLLIETLKFNDELLTSHNTHCLKIVFRQGKAEEHQTFLTNFA